jgi:NNP family nitrate/nitrite transporter-like MFS transporter
MLAIGAAAALWSVNAVNLPAFFASFMFLFVATGIGNGSTYRMIPSIFREEKLRTSGITDGTARLQAIKDASIESAAALGFIGAIGACGGYFIPRGFGTSIAMTGGPHLALAVYLAFYITCIALTWWYYMRRSFMVQLAPSLAEARV